jgi:hypothetical protein|tara:strand:+ start:97 stop:300 length:204 start_codon:yes stop_codon:yes gene_type:complete
MIKNYYWIGFIIFACVLLYFASKQYSTYGLNKSVSACIIATTKTYPTKTQDEIVKLCEDEIRGKKNK